jgi:hypothetical protein
MPTAWTGEVYESIADGIDMIDMGGGDSLSTRAYCALFNFKGGLQEKAISPMALSMAGEQCCQF